MLLTLPQVGRLTDRMDHGKLVLLGVVTTLIGTYAFTRVSEHSPYGRLCLALVVRGAGMGATSTPALASAYRHLSRDEIPNATTAINVVQRLGAPIGTAPMAVTLQRFAAHAGASRALLARAFAHTFVVNVALTALALVAALALIRANRETE
jgi:MFS family permease